MRALTILLAFALAALASDDSPPKPLPISAHNCYPNGSDSREPLERALALGIDNIEIDLGWDADSKRLIVGHDAKPRLGVVYPEFESYFIPAFEAHARKPRADGAPTVLTIDWKTSEPEAVARFKSFLDSHTEWFTSAPKAEPSPLSARRLTVCFTGSDRSKQHYDSLVPDGGVYRAFRDRVFGGGNYYDDVKAYAPDPATAFHRFLTLHWATVERAGPPTAGDWTPAEEARLRAMVEHLHGRGFRVRFYCLDRASSSGMAPYRFSSDEAAVIRWKAAAKAGVDWAASDDYAEITRELGR
jgi:hypothetical protein